MEPEDLVLGDAASASDPGDGGTEASKGEAGIERESLTAGEAAGKVDGGGAGLFLEDGEEGKHHQRQPYVRPRRRQETLDIHRLFFCFLLSTPPIQNVVVHWNGGTELTIGGKEKTNKSFLDCDVRRRIGLS